MPPNIGLCANYQHEKALTEIKPEEIKGNWTTLFVDQAKFRGFYQPSCMTSKFQPLTREDSSSLVQTNLEKHLLDGKITEKSGDTYTIRFDNVQKPMIGRQFFFGATNKFTTFLQPPQQYQGKVLLTMTCI